MLKTFTLALLHAALLLSGVLAQSGQPPVLPFLAIEHTFYADDGTQLSGCLFAPKMADSYPAVVFVWGSGDDDANQSNYTKAIAKTFTESGIAVFSYNRRGVGKSRGRYSETNFVQRAADTAAALRYAQSLPGVDKRRVGVWGISQAGWVIPKVIKLFPDIRFVILVSPAGVSPTEQVDYYLQNQWRLAGLNSTQLGKAIRLHHLLSAYYASGRGYRKAQLAVDRARKEGWLAAYGKVDYRQEVPSDSRLITPAQLDEAVVQKADDFEFVRAASTYQDSSTDALNLKCPTLLLYGSDDQLVPIEKSQAIFRKAFKRNGNNDVVLHVFPGADHDIQPSGKPTLLPGYREFMRDWIQQHSPAQ
jgi:uncharacterized protein